MKPKTARATVELTKNVTVKELPSPITAPTPQSGDIEETWAIVAHRDGPYRGCSLVRFHNTTEPRTITLVRDLDAATEEFS